MSAKNVTNCQNKIEEQRALITATLHGVTGMLARAITGSYQKGYYAASVDAAEEKIRLLDQIAATLASTPRRLAVRAARKG